MSDRVTECPVCGKDGCMVYWCFRMAVWVSPNGYSPKLRRKVGQKPAGGWNPHAPDWKAFFKWKDGAKYRTVTMDNNHVVNKPREWALVWKYGHRWHGSINMTASEALAEYDKALYFGMGVQMVRLIGDRGQWYNRTIEAWSMIQCHRVWELLGAR